MTTPTLKHERLLSLVHYDPETGVFRWLVGRGGTKPGDVMASKHNAGYLVGRIDRQPYLLHRLAWFYVHGVWPTDQIDHVNRNRSDNRLSNLRECDGAGNCQNVKPHADGSSGVLGVSFHRGARKWLAQITVKGRHVHLGLFEDKHEAGAAYLQAKCRIHQFAGEVYTP
jgi:hypothetical protein